MDILTEWREELADEQNIHALLQLAKDLLASEANQPLGPDELSYRQEQALYWLCKVQQNFVSSFIKITFLCLIVMRNFIVRQANFNSFLHPNEPPQRIFCSLQDNLRWTCQKFDIFSFQSKSTFSPKINIIFLKTIFVLENQIRRTCFIKIIFNYVHSQKNLFSKTVPYF